MKRPILISLVLMTAGCAPVASINGISDTAAGYRKSIEVRGELSGNSLVSQRVVHTQGRYSHARRIAQPPVNDGVQAVVPLEGSQLLARGTTIGVRYELNVKKALFDITDQVSSEAKFRVGSNARLLIASVPKCMHVGEEAVIRVRLSPSPRFDRIRVRPSESGTACISSPGRTIGATGGMPIKATCKGLVDLQLVAVDRPQIISANAPSQIKIVSPLASPGSLSTNVGDYKDPDQVGQPSRDFRAVTLRWQNPPDARETVVAIYTADDNKSVEQGLFDPGVSDYTAVLAVGKRYFWQIRTKYEGCLAEGEWSGYARHGSFDVPK